MKLSFKKYGEGKPLVLFHGLFGSGDNWTTHAKNWAQQGFCVYLVDQRNHGHSEHSTEMSYELMRDDAIELLAEENLRDIILMGHSMGGKTVMHVAQEVPFLVEKMIVVDMGVKAYPPHHDKVFDALHRIDLNHIQSRGEAESIMGHSEVDKATQLFLLKNLYWKEAGKLAWRFNLPVLESQMESILKAIPTTPTSDVNTLFIRGELSGYILPGDEEGISKIFPKNQLVTIPKSGHWPHAESPELFSYEVMRFCQH